MQLMIALWNTFLTTCGLWLLGVSGAAFFSVCVVVVVDFVFVRARASSHARTHARTPTCRHAHTHTHRHKQLSPSLVPSTTTKIHTHTDKKAAPPTRPRTHTHACARVYACVHACIFVSWSLVRAFSHTHTHRCWCSCAHLFHCWGCSCRRCPWVS
jgi:hypothetical protein